MDWTIFSSRICLKFGVKIKSFIFCWFHYQRLFFHFQNFRNNNGTSNDTVLFIFRVEKPASFTNYWYNYCDSLKCKHMFLKSEIFSSQFRFLSSSCSSRNTIRDFIHEFQRIFSPGYNCGLTSFQFDSCQFRILCRQQNNGTLYKLAMVVFSRNDKYEFTWLLLLKQKSGELETIFSIFLWFLGILDLWSAIE